jgi:bifunctional DNA-binding transcriptional regulator/antitoxin component of YhaV-PrlF toxin-antitoxin module
MSMLAKLTAKNQLTLPKRVLEALGSGPAPTYFEVEVRDGSILLTPARLGSADAVRRKLTELGITEADVDDAVTWARQRS